jgi:acyl-CoA thioester hydrolase
MAPAPFVTAHKLRFCDTDATGHVNNTAYGAMYEAGRAELFHGLGLLRDGGFSLVIARLEIDFLREMNWPGEVRIETGLHRIGGKSIHLRQRLLIGDELVSRAASVLAIIDRNTRRSVPVGEAWRGALEAYLVPDEP